ncbi:MAG: thioredoxin [Candidatus Omnitrophota bacterium]
MTYLNDKNFKTEVLDSEVPVLVDFYADWCQPCKMITPLIEELAKEQHGKLKVCKVNVEDSPQVTTTYGVMSIPTLIFFKDGKVSDQVTGVLTKQQLNNKIKDIL